MKVVTEEQHQPMSGIRCLPTPRHSLRLQVGHQVSDWGSAGLLLLSAGVQQSQTSAAQTACLPGAASSGAPSAFVCSISTETISSSSRLTAAKPPSSSFTRLAAGSPKTPAGAVCQRLSSLRCVVHITMSSTLLLGAPQLGQAECSPASAFTSALRLSMSALSFSSSDSPRAAALAAIAAWMRFMNSAW